MKNIIARNIYCCGLQCCPSGANQIKPNQMVDDEKCEWWASLLPFLSNRIESNSRLALPTAFDFWWWFYSSRHWIKYSDISLFHSLNLLATIWVPQFFFNTFILGEKKQQQQQLATSSWKSANEFAKKNLMRNHGPIWRKQRHRN